MAVQKNSFKPVNLHGAIGERIEAPRLNDVGLFLCSEREFTAASAHWLSHQRGLEKTPFPVSPFSHRADVRAEQANESEERSLARALNVAVSQRSVPLSDADREAF